MIPSNIEAAAISSICEPCTAKEFIETYKVPPEFELCAPTPEQRAPSPPPGYAAIYTLSFEDGLRLPLPPFVVSILAHYKIPLAQLHPNSIISLIGFMKICENVSIAPTPTLFRHFFQLVSNNSLKEGWYNFEHRPLKIVHLPQWYNFEPGRLKIVHLPHFGLKAGWKESFLFFKTAPTAGNLPLSWNYNSIKDPPLSQHERPSAETVKKLMDNAVVYPFVSAEEEERKSCSSKMKVVPEMEAEKSSIEKEPTVVSTESLSAVCMVKGMAESLATKECVGGSLQVPSVPSSKDLTPEKEELEKLVAALKQGIRDKNNEISSLEEKLEKLVAAMEHDVKVKDREIAFLKSENSKLKSVGDVASLQRDKDNLEKAMERSVKVKDKEIALLKSENSRIKNVCDDRGLLLNVYTWKLLKTKGFARFFNDLRTLARSVGRHEAAELMRSRCPGIPEEAFVGLEDPQAASKLKNQFADMIQDCAFEFPLLDHLLSLAEIPSSYQLKDLEVDEDKDALEVV